MIRGEVYLVDFDPVQGSEQGGKRPALIIQNNIGNHHSPTTIVAAITSTKRKNLPTHVPITPEEVDLTSPSLVLTEQIRTIDKGRIKRKLGLLDNYKMSKVEDALMASLGISGGAYVISRRLS